MSGLGSVSRDRLCAAFLATCLLVFALRSLHTASVYNGTYDEPAHIAAGLELWQYNRYTIEAKHTPISRLLVSLPLFIGGVRFESDPRPRFESDPPTGDMWEEGNILLYERTSYQDALLLARASTTIVAVVLLFGVYSLARASFGAAGACAAIALASCSPGLLGHASLATTDLMAAGSVLAALHTWRVFVQRGGGVGRALLVGVAGAAAFLTKLTALPIFLVACPAIALWFRRQDGARPWPRWGEWAAMALAASAMVWAAYGFVVAPIALPTRVELWEARLAGVWPPLGELFARVAPVRLPFGYLARGVVEAAGHGGGGHEAYLGGEYSQHGWPHYFLVTTALKVPLGMLLGAIGGLALAIRSRSSVAGREVLLVTMIGVCILAAVTYGGINVGHRHVLAVEYVLALMAAGGLRLALDEQRPTRRRLFLSLAGSALLASTIASIRAHPDALGYTNALAGPSPDRWFVDSNLDWGQDLERLRMFLLERGVPPRDVHLGYFGTARPARHGLAEAQPLEPNTITSGWIAISVTLLRAVYLDEPHDQFGWLLGLPEAGRVGTSIRLYRVTPEEAEKLRERHPPTPPRIGRNTAPPG